MNAESIRWRVPHDAHLRWRVWDGDHVLYHGASGDTHHMGAAAREALETLASRPMTAAELAEHLSANAGVRPDETFDRNVDELLRRLDELGLIEIAS